VGWPTLKKFRRRKRSARFIAGLALAAVLLGLGAVTGFDSRLDVRSFDIVSAKVSAPVRLVLVTDYHSCDYGPEQIELVSAIDAAAPDAVLFAGDIFDDDIPFDNSEELFTILAPKYPLYYVTGNHELWSRRSNKIKEFLQSTGVQVLTGNYEPLTLPATNVIAHNQTGSAKTVSSVSSPTTPAPQVASPGTTVLIGGVDDPDIDNYSKSVPSYAAQLAKLSDATDNEFFTIILSHRPDRINDFLPVQPDLVLSGHAHGGQWRLPFILENGLFAPDQGLFPQYTNGIYHFGDTDMIVSRGLARESTAIPRFHNRPELIIINLTPA